MELSDPYTWEERKVYWKNGNVWIVEYKRNGKLNGKRKTWYATGQLCEREFYQDGKLEGERKTYHENGQLHILESYQNGLREGESKAWYPNGTFMAHRVYRNGLIGEEKVFMVLADILYHHFHFWRYGHLVEISFSMKKKMTFLKAKRSRFIQPQITLGNFLIQNLIPTIVKFIPS